MTRPRILYVVATCPFPAKRGKNIRQGAILTSLITCGETSLVVLDPPVSGPPADIIGLAGLHLLPGRMRIDPLSDLALVQSTLRRGHGIMSRKYLHPLAMDRFAALLDRLAPDLVVLGGIDMAALVEPCLRRGLTVVVDSDDLQSLRTARICSSLPLGAQRLFFRLLTHNYRAIERRSLARVDQVWVSSARESLLARHLYDLRSVHFVPNVLDLARYRPQAVPCGPEPVIGFLGNYSYLPNEQAALALIAMHGRLRAAGHRCRLTLIGIGPSAAMRAAAAGNQGIVITGEVPEIAAALAEVTVMAVPLIAGGGTKIKVLESMALGKPLIMTEVGAEGLGVVPGRDAVVCDLDRFENELIALLADPQRCTAIGAAGRALVEQRFSLAALQQQIAGLVGEVLAHARPKRASSGRRRAA